MADHRAVQRGRESYRLLWFADCAHLSTLLRLTVKMKTIATFAQVSLCTGWAGES